VRVSGVALNNHWVITTGNNDMDISIQDDTAAIGVFQSGFTGSNDPNRITPLQGVNFEVWGNISQFRGRTRIDITNLGGMESRGTRVIPEPVINNDALYFTTFATAEQYEGMIVGIRNVALQVGETWPTASAAGAITRRLIDTKGNEFIVSFSPRSDNFGTSDTWNFPQVGTRFDIKGILWQQKQGATSVNNVPPFLEDYRIVISSFDNFAPLPEGTLSVTLSVFSANVIEGESVSISWSTESEYSLLGFDVFRSTKNDFDSATRINSSIILANNSSYTHRYFFEDGEVLDGNRYFYWLRAMSSDGTTMRFGPVDVIIETKEVVLVLPQITTLSSVFPNPVRIDSQSHFAVNVKANEIATLRIFNVRGQLVREFDPMTTGVHRVTWDHKNNNNREVATGIYFYRLQSQSVNTTQRMAVIK
jgi:hypothetical protein